MSTNLRHKAQLSFPTYSFEGFARDFSEKNLNGWFLIIKNFLLMHFGGGHATGAAPPYNGF